MAGRINMITDRCSVQQPVNFDGLFSRSLTVLTRTERTVFGDMLFNAPLAKHMSTIEYEQQLDYLCQWIDAWTAREVCEIPF